MMLILHTNLLLTVLISVCATTLLFKMAASTCWHAGSALCSVSLMTFCCHHDKTSWQGFRSSIRVCCWLAFSKEYYRGGGDNISSSVVVALIRFDLT